MRGCAKTPPGRRLCQLDGSPGGLAPPGGRDGARPELQHLVDDGNGYVRANVTHMIPEQFFEGVQQRKATVPILESAYPA